MATEMVENGADQTDGRVGIVKHKLGEQAVRLAGQRLPQPGVDQLREDEVCLIPIHHAGTRVDVRLDRIGRE